MSPRYVIIADDELGLRQTLFDVLSAAGYDARAFHSKQEALDSMKTRLPDLIISDINSKDMDGFTLLRLLRLDPKTSSVPVVIETGFSGEGVEEEVKKAGAAAYLKKPYRVEDLLACVKKLVPLA